LGENVTLGVRELLYTNILRKNIGWFDLRENSTGVLSSAMASDTAVINGVSSESLGPQVEGSCALLTGMFIGFYYCWQQSVIMVFVAPFMAIGQLVQIKL
jgi:ATP-binding cassette subfamily B (MDR/TAP) protein 1